MRSRDCRRDVAHAIGDVKFQTVFADDDYALIRRPVPGSSAVSGPGKSDTTLAKRMLVYGFSAPSRHSAR